MQVALQDCLRMGSELLLVDAKKEWQMRTHLDFSPPFDSR